MKLDLVCYGGRWKVAKGEDNSEEKMTGRCLT